MFNALSADGKFNLYMELAISRLHVTALAVIFTIIIVALSLMTKSSSPIYFESKINRIELFGIYGDSLR